MTIRTTVKSLAIGAGALALSAFAATAQSAPTSGATNQQNAVYVCKWQNWQQVCGWVPANVYYGSTFYGSTYDARLRAAASAVPTP
jgi:hypothetical protein